MSRIGRSEEARRGPKLLADFDPNLKPLPRPEHATYAPFRLPPWKIHSGIGHAKSAVATHSYIIRYRYEEPTMIKPNKANGTSGGMSAGGWVEVERRCGEERKEW